MEKMPKDFNLRKAIQAERDYKSNVQRRDKNSRKFLNEECDKASASSLNIGALYLFEYKEPKTKEELEYYDAMPCSILFGRFLNKNKEERILGYNLHYFPPRIRYVIMERIFEIFKPFYKKYWDSRSPQDISYFDYMMLIHQLEKAKLDFGVREYIPKLIGKCLLVKPLDWSKAVLTEGRFMKTTRENIIRYWKAREINKDLLRRASKGGSK